jgi:RNA polymerase sigma-70 factor (ECF subfamily)
MSSDERAPAPTPTSAPAGVRASSPAAASSASSAPAGRLSEASDLELVGRLQKGESAVFREIVRRHQDKVYRLALRLTRDEARAQDAMQDAFLQVFRKVHQFQEQSAFTTWLYRITVNAALMRMRSERRHHETSLDEASPRYTEAGEIAEPVDDWSTAVDDDAGNRELAKYAAMAVDELPETYRSVFVLRELEEMSTEDVAQILELTVPTVKTRLHRARLALRKVLAERVKGTDLESKEK